MLSKKAKYALKALEYVARHQQRAPLLIQEISDEQRIPKKFLEAILLDLKRDGILQSRKGQKGGYGLLKKARDINIGHVIRLFDGPLALVPCVSFKYYQRCEECIDEETCGLRLAMHELRLAHQQVLEKISLADVLKNELRLQQKKKRQK
jgi:Rrf2 family protein